MIDLYDEYNINYEYIVRYLQRTIKPSEGILPELERYAAAHEVPIAQPETMRFLEVLLRCCGAKNVLEIGTAIGYSSIAMASCGCCVKTIELSDEMVRLARENIERAGFSHQIEVISGDAVDVLPHMEGSFDFIFLDASKAHYQDFFPHLHRMLRPGGVLVSDNVLYRGMVATDELFVRRKVTIIKRLREYVEMLCNHEEYDTSLIPIGDGMSISFKKSC